MRRDLDAPLDIGRLPEIKKREHAFEYDLRDELKTRDVMFVKLKPTIEGFPDRLAINWGRTRLVELKREGEGLSETQVLVHAELKRRGVKVMVIHGPDVKAAADRIALDLRRGR